MIQNHLLRESILVLGPPHFNTSPFSPPALMFTYSQVLPLLITSNILFSIILLSDIYSISSCFLIQEYQHSNNSWIHPITSSLSNSLFLCLLLSLPSLDSIECHHNSLACTLKTFVLLYLHCTALRKPKPWLYSTLPTLRQHSSH